MKKSTRNALLLSLAGFAAKRIMQHYKSKNVHTDSTQKLAKRDKSFQDTVAETLLDTVQQKWSQAVLRADSYMKNKA